MTSDKNKEIQKINFRIIQTVMGILKVKSNKELLIDFKNKYNLWSREFYERWNSCETAKSNGFKALKPSQFIRITMTAIIFFSILEYFRTTNMLFLPLAFSTVVAFLAVYVKAVIVLTYITAPWKYLTRLLEYFKAVNTMSTRFSQRLNVIQQTFHLNFDCHNLDLHNEYKTHRESWWNVLVSENFVFNIYGVLLAVIIFGICLHTQNDSFLLFEALIIYFLIIVALWNDVINFASYRVIRRIQKEMVTITDDFKIWFRNNCELKNILQELGLNDEKLFLFPTQNVLLVNKEPYLNTAIFLTMFENTLRRYLNTNKVDELFLFLLNNNDELFRKSIIIGVNVCAKQKLGMPSDNFSRKEKLPVDDETDKQNLPPNNLDEKENLPIRNQNAKQNLSESSEISDENESLSIDSQNDIQNLNVSPDNLDKNENSPIHHQDDKKNLNMSPDNLEDKENLSIDNQNYVQNLTLLPDNLDKNENSPIHDQDDKNLNMSPDNLEEKEKLSMDNQNYIQNLSMSSNNLYEKENSSIHNQDDKKNLNMSPSNHSEKDNLSIHNQNTSDQTCKHGKEKGEKSNIVLDKLTSEDKDDARTNMIISTENNFKKQMKV